MIVTVIDTETTGLKKPDGTDLTLCPYIIEIYAAQFEIEDGGRNSFICREFETFIKPPVPIPGFITKITGINDEMVKSSPSFVEVYKDLIKIFLGSEELIAANLNFDQYMLITELRRIGKEYHFPYPPKKFCTIEQSMHKKGYRLKNSELYKIATGNEIIESHRAKNDALATFESYKWLKRERQ